MSKKAIWSGILGLVLVVTVGVGWRSTQPAAADVQSRLILPPEAIGFFERVTGPIPLSFPKDFGAHEEYQTEWWYYTGNLTAQDGREFGYQLTFFRRALQGAAEQTSRDSQWGTEQVYLAHFALTDVGAGTYRAFERTERGAVGLAGALVGRLSRALP